RREDLLMTGLVPSWFFLVPLLAQAPTAGGGPTVPAAHIPPAVVVELKHLENQFDLALMQDCAPERCFSKGCSYGEHAVVDKPRATALPGLGAGEGPGSVAPQEYLTRARCEFAHEKSVPAKDVQALIRRLQAKLSKGWLVVSVERQMLEPVPAGLRESPLPPVPPAPVVPPPAPVAPTEPPKWELATAMRELWVSLLPHFSWMIALFLGTLVSLTIIWAARRLGRESLEEKALMAQLAQGGAPGAGEKEAAAAAEAPKALPGEGEKLLVADSGEDLAFVDGQRKLWNERIASAQITKGESVVLDVLREWLSTGEFALLAKAVFVFADKLSLAFPSEGELAQRKLEFADYLRNVDESKLPSDAEFFRKLNQHALSSAVMVQPDADAYRSLREDFGAAGIARLTESLPARSGALLFALAPPDHQDEVARGLTPELRRELAGHLLASNRIAKEEVAHLIAVGRAARTGAPVPEGLLVSGVGDRGREFDAAGALSTLLPHLDDEVRAELFAAALERSNGVFPRWYGNIMFAGMLQKVPDELQKDLVLEVDLRELAGWLSVQQAAWHESFVKKLAPSLQSALRATAFGSRTDQLGLARRGQHALAAALQRQVARGTLSFAKLVL
ncbi:MAG: hypothetical protein ACYC8T_34530, partial [Myxococcaceae bacterium]